MSKLVLLSVFTMLIAAVSACGDASADVEGPTWTLTELNGSPPLEGTSIDLTISEGSVSGSSGCNRYTGTVTVSNGEMTLGPNLAGTMMSCEDDVQAQETAFIDALLAVTGYEVSGETLSLLDAEGNVVARFE